MKHKNINIMAKVFANVCFCDILNAVLRFARDVRYFAFCVQFLDLYVKLCKLLKNKTVNIKFGVS